MEPKRKSGISRLLQLAGKKKALLFASGLLAIIHSLLSLVPYILVFYIIKELTKDSIDFDLTRQYIIYAIIAAIASMIIFYFSGILSHIAAYNILYELRVIVTEKIGKLSLGKITTKNSGIYKKILSDDVERIENFIAHQIPDFIKGIALPLITIAYLFTQDWRLALVSLIPLLIIGIGIKITQGNNSNREELVNNYHDSLGKMNAGIVEYVNAMPVMKIFGQTAENFNKYGNTVRNFNHFVNKWIKSGTPTFAIFMSFASNAMLPVLVIGLLLYFNGGVNIATLLLFLILGTGYIKPLFVLNNMTMQLSIITYGVKQIDDVLYSEELQDKQEEQKPLNYDIRFDNVTFSYTKDNNVLENIDLTIPQGTIAALVGPSGAGKSTVAQLLARFWDVSYGEITIGNIPLKDYPLSQLMQIVSYVFQDSFMFQESMFENIKMGMDRTKEQVIQAAKTAQIHDLIMSLPNGYDTLFGQSGVHLSGGEQQRFQLARAILKDAPILILDEATAFSDPENEYKIQQAFSELIKNKTVLIIAHRLSTITDADQIIVFEKGKINAVGTQEELLVSSQLYQRMWNAHQRAKEFKILK